MVALAREETTAALLRNSTVADFRGVSVSVLSSISEWNDWDTAEPASTGARPGGGRSGVSVSHSTAGRNTTGFGVAARSSTGVASAGRSDTAEVAAAGRSDTAAAGAACPVVLGVSWGESPGSASGIPGLLTGGDGQGDRASLLGVTVVVVAATASLLLEPLPVTASPPRRSS